MTEHDEEMIRQNVLLSKMLEYFLEKQIITPKDIQAFLEDFNRQSEEEILQTRNPLHNETPDTGAILDM